MLEECVVLAFRSTDFAIITLLLNCTFSFCSCLWIGSRWSFFSLLLKLKDCSLILSGHVVTQLFRKKVLATSYIITKRIRLPKRNLNLSWVMIQLLLITNLKLIKWASFVLIVTLLRFRTFIFIAKTKQEGFIYHILIPQVTVKHSI